MSINLGMILDSFVIVLLAVTIYFCLRLNAKLNELRASRREFAELVKTIDDAMVKTHKSIATLRDAAGEVGRKLETDMARAEELTGDLSFMVDVATKLASRLEEGYVRSKAVTRETGERGLPSSSARLTS